MTSSSKTPTKGPLIVQDLRKGEYMAINPCKFAGNIMLVGETYYQVQNNTSWKRVEKPVS